MIPEVIENQTVGIITNVSPLPKTYEEFLEWNGTDGVWAEWVEGEVFEMSNPSLIHQDISDFLTAILRFFVEANQLGRVISAPFQLKLESRNTGRQPDIMFISKANSDNVKKQYVDKTADLVIEIISPESRTRDKGDKFYEYEQAGVKEFWLIDPDRKRAEFYTLGEDSFFNFEVAENGIYYSKVLDGLFIKTDWLWQENLPTLMEVLKDWKLM
ncbi:MAG: Uma2 family endonuclease [Pyrinomonadaceae bacterium]|nr:Uma2 family endonuclease [Pyrinomonadaceae bacterium]